MKLINFFLNIAKDKLNDKIQDYINTSSDYYDKEEYEKAIYFADKALSVYPQTYDAYIIKAKSENQLDNYDKALEYINKAIEIKSDYEAYNTRGHIELCMEQYETAFNDFEYSLSLEENDDAYFGKAMFYNCTDNTKSALENINKAIEINPNCENYFRFRAEIYNILDKYNEAIDDVNIALKINPESNYAYTERARAEFYLNMHAEALADCDMALKIAPSDFDSLWLKGEIYFDINRYNASLEMYKEMEETGYKDKDLYLDYAYCHLHLKQFNNALNYISKIPENDENYPDATFLKGLIKLYLKDYKEASIHFNNAIKADNDDLGAYAYNAISNILMKNTNETVKMCDLCMQKAEDDDTFIKGVIKMLYGEYNEAVNYFLEDLKESPFDIENLYFTAYCYKKLNNIEKSEEYYKKAHEFGDVLFPEYIEELIPISNAL